MAHYDVLTSLQQQARLNGNAVALAEGESTVTYSQLVGRVRGVARCLHDRGAQPGDRIGLFADNCVAYVIAMLAIMQARCAFVSLPLRDPAERLMKILQAAAPVLILSDEKRSLESTNVVNLQSAMRAEVSEEEEEGDLPDGDAIAYVLFTSGSTGEPKGVCIPRCSFGHAVFEAGTRMRFGAHTRSLSILPLQFDGSFSSVFPVLMSGGSAYINRGPICLPKAFCGAFERYSLTHATFTPSYLKVLLSASDWSADSCRSWQTLAIGGEDLDKASLRQLKSQCPAVAVFNRYGPTETTMAVSTHEVTDQTLESPAKIPLGRPHSGVEFVALNAAGKPIQPEEAGELYIGGSQLMRGYLNDEATTRGVLSSTFVPGKTLYRTGDIVTIDQDGQYVYLGRANNVIKRDGNRISLDEIETALGKIRGVAASACISLQAGSALKILALITPADPHIEVKALRQSLAEHLPAYMNPDHIELIADMPTTANGKIDRKELGRRFAGYLQPAV
jgi:D-alanine--poly(phosphoribitol) ligase subunit 1